MSPRSIIWAACALLFAGCSTDSGPNGKRFVLGVPTAGAQDKVYLRHDAKMAHDGNTYSIRWGAMTNTNSSIPHPLYDAELATNRWPVKRNHIDLSLDGGATWVRRIGFGVQIDKDRLNGEMMWSPPEDYTLLSTNARLRIVTLDGEMFGTGTNYPFDIPPGRYIQSDQFTIAGIGVLYPDAESVWYSGSPNVLQWSQAGAGSDISAYWVTPGTVSAYTNHLIGRWTNCVEGFNQQDATITAPPSPEVRIVLRSMQDMAIIGYSPVFTLEP